MALFFDSAWFDARLAAAGLTRAHAAAALGLTQEQVAELWKDQRELSVGDVRVLSALLAAPAAEIASRAGIATPVPDDVLPEAAVLRELADRMTRIEAALAELRTLVLALSDSS